MSKLSGNKMFTAKRIDDLLNDISNIDPNKKRIDKTTRKMYDNIFEQPLLLAKTLRRRVKQTIEKNY